MIDALRQDFTTCVEVIYEPDARGARTEGMVFSELEAHVAMETPDSAVHRETATALAEALSAHLR